eukprot:6180028-Pleurochrysis_carterae.AAC.2
MNIAKAFGARAFPACPISILLPPLPKRTPPSPLAGVAGAESGATVHPDSISPSSSSIWICTSSLHAAITAIATAVASATATRVRKRASARRHATRRRQARKSSVKSECACRCAIACAAARTSGGGRAGRTETTGLRCPLTNMLTVSIGPCRRSAACVPVRRLRAAKAQARVSFLPSVRLAERLAICLS